MNSKKILLILALSAIIVLIMYVIYSPASSEISQKKQTETSGYAAQEDNSNPEQDSPTQDTPETTTSDDAGSKGEEDSQFALQPNQNECSSESRNVESCPQGGEPVCGWYDPTNPINCNWGPCVRGVFPNACEACRTQNIIYWTEGDCPIHG